MERSKKQPTILALQLLLLAVIACAPNLQKMVPESEALSSKPADRSIHIAPVSGGSKSSALSDKSSISSDDFKTVLIESIQKSGLFTEVTFDESGETSDYQLFAKIVSQRAGQDRAWLKVRYRIDAGRWDIEKTFQSSYSNSNSSFYGSRKPLERAVKDNVKSLLRKLSKLHKEEEAYDSFVKAQKSNSIETYTTFLQAYGGSIFAREAKLNIERLALEKAKRDNTVAVYKEFLAKYSRSTFANEARDAITTLKFEQAKTIDTPVSYLAFLNENPNSKHEAEAHRSLVEVQNRRAAELTVIFDSVSTVDIQSDIFEGYDLTDFLRAIPVQKRDAQLKAFEGLNQILTQDGAIILDVIDYLESEEEDLPEGARLTLEHVKNDGAVDALFVNAAQYEGSQLEQAMAFLERNQAPQQVERFVRENNSDRMDDFVANFLTLTVSPDRKIRTQSLQLLEQLVSADSSAILICLDYLTGEDEKIAHGAKSCFLLLHNPEGVEPIVDYLHKGYDDWELAYILTYLRRHQAPEYEEIIRQDESTISASLSSTLAETANPGFVAFTIDTGPPGVTAVREEFNRLKKKYDDAAADEAGLKALGFLFTALDLWQADEEYYIDDWTAFRDHHSRPAVEDKEYFRYRFTSVLEGIKRIRNPELIPAIQNELRNPANDEIIFKRALCLGWGNIGNDAFPSIMNGLKDRQLEKYAEQALYNLGGRDAASLIISQLQDEDNDIRYYCVNALSRMGSPEAVAALKPLRSDKSIKVREAARAGTKLGRANPGINDFAQKLEGTNKTLKIDVLKVGTKDPTNVYPDGQVLYRARYFTGNLSLEAPPGQFGYKTTETITATAEQFVRSRGDASAFEYSRGSLVFIDKVKLGKNDIKIEIRRGAGKKLALRLKFNKANYTLAEVKQAFSYAFVDEKTLKPQEKY